MDKLLISNLGYPRIGFNREWKKVLEMFWNGKLSENDFLSKMKAMRLKNVKKQVELGVNIVPVNDFTLYDHVLDTAVMFGIIPKRYQHQNGLVSLTTYYAMARGQQEVVACEMTKWFNTNYHYIVPEYETGMNLALLENKPLDCYREVKKELGISGKPVLVGPFSFAKFSKGNFKSIPCFVEQLMPLYIQLLKQLENEGVNWIQIDEPFLVTSLLPREMDLIATIYNRFNESVPKLKILLQTYFGSVDYYQNLISLPVQGIGLDFVQGYDENFKNLKKFKFPSEKILAVGLIDGRNIWRADLEQSLNLLNKIFQFVPKKNVWIQPSCSLFLTPVSKVGETNLKPVIFNAIVFAEEKLKELKSIADAFNLGFNYVSEAIKESTEAIKDLNKERALMPLAKEIEDLNHLDLKRSDTFEQRFDKQKLKLKIPFLPVTTIGSFPQTEKIRQCRNDWKKKKISTEEYEQFIDKEIKKWIDIQEEIGIDVLVHGEPERNDMVEYFGSKLDGFISTQNGWIQSYGSRCVKPPIIYGNVNFIAPMTVRESAYAQSLTSKPVKGMLTGPVTILNWSFVRNDISRSQVCLQIAWALQKEILALEKAGINIIQVDEPAVREGLPLKKQDWDEYLNWAVKAFRCATYKVKPETQIHTHMCYGEFQDIIEKISDLDADVISIETSRSHGEIITYFEKYKYSKSIGLGVYDIHSPRIPSKEEIIEIISRAMKVVDKNLFWVNPDCGLKTRTEKETILSLQNMVAAAKHLRKIFASN